MERMTLTAALAMVILAAAGCANDEKSAARQTSGGDTRAMGVYGAGGEDGDEAVTLEECPEAVRATIRAHMDGGEITELERTTDHGEVLYEVDVRTGGGVVEFDVAADGTFRGYEGADDDDDDAEDDGAAGDFFGLAWDDEDDEEEIPLSDVPEAVMNAAKAAVPGIVFEEAEREVEDGVTVYSLEGEAGGVEYEVEVTADGKVNEVETEGDDGDEDD